MLPDFTTERLFLRRRSLADTDACLAMDRAPGVTRFVAGPWSDPDAHRAFIEARTRGPYPAGLGYWSVFARAAPADFLGWVLLIPVEAQGPAVEIGWRLVPAAWGMGIATEAARPVVAHGFESVLLDEIIADIDVENAASIRVAEKLGLTRQGETVYAGRPAIHMALTRKTFFAQWQGGAP